jgi:hypothetical protein
MSTETTATPPLDRMAALTDPEMAYVARWVAITHPEIADEGLAALAAYRRDHADKAALLLGAEMNGGQ